MKIYARTTRIHDPKAGQVPYNRNVALAIEGFHEMGFEIVFYSNVHDILDQFEYGDILLDVIDQINTVLGKFDLQMPKFDYPEELSPYFGRKIWKDTINHISRTPEIWPVFVKPTTSEKAFTGVLVKSPRDLIGCGSCYENYEVYCSEPVEFVYEVRGLCYYGKLLDLRPYKGDWKYASKLDTKLIEKAANTYFESESALNGCTLDFGVTKDGRTLFIEGNGGAAFGPYSTNATQYAKIISAYMSQIYGIKDECKFDSLDYERE